MCVIISERFLSFIITIKLIPWTYSMLSFVTNQSVFCHWFCFHLQTKATYCSAQFSPGTVEFELVWLSFAVRFLFPSINCLWIWYETRLNLFFQISNQLTIFVQYVLQTWRSETVIQLQIVLAKPMCWLWKFITIREFNGDIDRFKNSMESWVYSLQQNTPTQQIACIYMRTNYNSRTTRRLSFCRKKLKAN